MNIANGYPQVNSTGIFNTRMLTGRVRVSWYLYLWIHVPVIL